MRSSEKILPVGVIRKRMTDSNGNRTRKPTPDVTKCRFGRIIAFDIHNIQRNGVYWNGVCDCGNKVIVASKHLINGTTKSCGCLQAEVAAIYAKAKAKHGMHGTRVYRQWSGMRGRCLNKKAKDYKNYGGRGIGVCDEWSDFRVFYADMGNPPEGFQIERINNNAGYSKTNCCWASSSTQGRNKRNNRVVEAFGERLTVAQWEERTGILLTTICGRLNRGWDPERAVSK